MRQHGERARRGPDTLLVIALEEQPRIEHVAPASGPAPRHSRHACRSTTGDRADPRHGRCASRHGQSIKMAHYCVRGRRRYRRCRRSATPAARGMRPDDDDGIALGLQLGWDWATEAAATMHARREAAARGPRMGGGLVHRPSAPSTAPRERSSSLAARRDALEQVDEARDGKTCCATCGSTTATASARFVRSALAAKCGTQPSSGARLAHGDLGLAGDAAAIGQAPSTPTSSRRQPAVPRQQE